MDDRLGEQRHDRLRRARWRLRGALLWPMFAVLTVVDAAIMHWLPIAGEGTHWVPALLLAGCLNIAAVALLGSLGGFALRRLRPGLPKIVADDRAGTTVLGLLASIYVVAGMIHAPELDAQREAFGAQSDAVRRWVQANGDRYARGHVDLADAIRIDENLYRTCIPSADPRRFLCLVVDTGQSPPRVKRDDNRESNTSLNGRRGFR